MGGKSSRTKGHSFEREIAREFKKVFGPEETRRGLQYRDGADAPDVMTPIFHIECKRRKKCDPQEALRQAFSTCEAGKYPLAVTKEDRQPRIVSLYFDDFIEIINEWWDWGNR